MRLAGRGQSEHMGGCPAGAAMGVGDVCPHSLRHNVNLNKYFKCKMYIVLDFLSQCDEATNNKNLSKRPNPLEMQNFSSKKDIKIMH